MKAAIDKRGKTKYTRQRTVDLYPASGNAIDWCYGRVPRGGRLPYAFQIELPPAFAPGTSGYVLPPERIIPVGSEILDGFLAMVEYAHANVIKQP